MFFGTAQSVRSYFAPGKAQSPRRARHPVYAPTDRLPPMAFRQIEAKCLDAGAVLEAASGGVSLPLLITYINHNQR